MKEEHKSQAQRPLGSKGRLGTKAVVQVANGPDNNKMPPLLRQGNSSEPGIQGNPILSSRNIREIMEAVHEDIVMEQDPMDPCKKKNHDIPP